MLDLIQTIIAGFTMGGIYALAALGLVLLFKASGIVNFAHGNMGMISTFVAYSLLTGSFRASADGFVNVFLSYPLAIGGGLLFSVILGLLVERLVTRPLIVRSHFHPVMACIGVLMLLDSLAGWIWSHEDKIVPSVFPEFSVLNLYGVFISYNNLFILGVTALVIILFHLFITYTRFGLATRCVTEDLGAARMMGINHKRVFAVSWGVATFMGGLAGILLAPQLYLNPNFMIPVLIKGFVAAVIGGFSNIYGAILGGIFLGLLESLTTVYITTELKEILAFAIIIVILSFRPSGLIPEKKISREV